MEIKAKIKYNDGHTEEYFAQSKAIKIKGLKKAIGDYKYFLEKGHHGIIQFDTETDEIWTDEFVDCNSYNVYPPHILNISAMMRECIEHGEFECENVNMDSVRSFIEKFVLKKVR